MGPKLAAIVTFILLILFVVVETFAVKHFLGDVYMPLSLPIAFCAGYFGTDIQHWLMGKK